jgi:hypothetical protein
MKKGLRVSIYRSDYDCHLNSLHGKKQAVLIGADIPEIIEADEDCPELVLMGAKGKYNYCEPNKSIPEGHTSYMDGGTFIYSCDSRFPFEGAIPVHDRTETWELYDRMSR